MIKEKEFTELLIYTTPQGKINVEVFLHNENVWLPQKKLPKYLVLT